MTTTIYRRTLVYAKDSPDGESPTTLEVERGEQYSLLIYHTYSEVPRVLAISYRTLDARLVEQAVKFVLPPDKGPKPIGLSIY